MCSGARNTWYSKYIVWSSDTGINQVITLNLNFFLLFYCGHTPIFLKWIFTSQWIKTILGLPHGTTPSSLCRRRLRAVCSGPPAGVHTTALRLIKMYIVIPGWSPGSSAVCVIIQRREQSVHWVMSNNHWLCVISIFNYLVSGRWRSEWFNDFLTTFSGRIEQCRCLLCYPAGFVDL